MSELGILSLSEQLSVTERQLENLLGLLDKCLSEDLVQEVRQFVDVGEYGLALETVIGIFLEENIPIPEVVRSEIKECSERMGLEVSSFLRGGKAS
ncbi:MafI family immunity protein [Roseibium suaedae]|uniref:MafI family immunity protein n=1 Tax=Roseibium suaedae TaxID=735517 RepID=A0A1M7B8U1_9HYPH|nr:MafI family immunity protein [Roseibium suaedae]SHL51438.1 hypothetical protein SAMN05444272_0761 [Roseibium suaedae]